jgi:hypothetical protein
MEFQAADPRASWASSVTTAAFGAGHVFNGVEGENRRPFPAHVAVL